jgi:hypothetical protein
VLILTREGLYSLCVALAKMEGIDLPPEQKPETRTSPLSWGNFHSPPRKPVQMELEFNKDRQLTLPGCSYALPYG